MLVAKSAMLFFLAGLAEIGGGYLVWLWLKERWPLMFGVFGAVVLFIYGVIPTFQPASFGRVYAAYGGVFVVMSLLWGRFVDKKPLDLYDVVGAVVVVAGVGLIMFAPRGRAG